MPVNKDKLTLINLKDGLAIEMFNVELKNVLENIADVDTADGTRKINLVVKFKPDSKRELTKIEIECKSVLQPKASILTTAVIEQGVTGEFELLEWVTPKQQELGFSERKSPAEDYENVADFREEKEKKSL